MNRVAITGIGIVSCFGRGKAAAIDALRSGRSGISRLRSIDSSTLLCQIGGEVPAEAHEGLYKGNDRFTRLALIAAEEAAAEANFSAIGLPPERIGALIGTGLGGCETLDAAYKRIYGEGLTRVAPTSIALSMYNAATSAESMRVLAVDNVHPEAACRPFSADRKGIVLAEGAAVLILESLDHAHRRGQPVLGEIAGFGATSDAGHLTDPSTDGAARAMAMALADAGIVANEVDYINAHGTGTRANDATETAAIKTVFGTAAYQIPVSSTKSLHGHAMGASGAIEIAASLAALSEGVIPPTINLDAPDPECDLDYVANAARQGRVGTFLSNSFGFGGMNAVVALRVGDR